MRKKTISESEISKLKPESFNYKRREDQHLNLQEAWSL
jgi:hypothetical protein